MKKKMLIGMTLLCLLAAAMALSGCWPQTEPETGSDTGTDKNQLGQEIEVTLYFSDDQAMYLVGEIREITINPSSPQMASKQAGEIVRELIAGPRDPDLIPTIPAETQLNGVEISEGVATVDFSEEIVTEHPGGSTGELMTVYSLVNSLTELPEINEVQILVDGQTIDSLAGHMDLTQPLGRDDSIIQQ